MHKTESLRHILPKILRRNGLESKINEQRIFDIWRTHVEPPFNTYAAPISFSMGVLKIYTEYSPCKSGILLQKAKIIGELNAGLEQPLLTDLRVELRPVPPDKSVNLSETHDESSESADSNTPSLVTPEELERIEQTLANVTDTRLKDSLRQLFTTQIRDKP